MCIIKEENNMYYNELISFVVNAIIGISVMTSSLVSNNKSSIIKNDVIRWSMSLITLVTGATIFAKGIYALIMMIKLMLR